MLCILFKKFLVYCRSVIFRWFFGPVAQWLEHTLDKRGVVSSTLTWPIIGGVAQLVERMLCKHDAKSSNLFTSTKI